MTKEVFNVGHGHVYPRTDGVKARCGGPGICKECSSDLAHQQREQAPSKELIDRLRNSSSIEHPCSPGLARRAADEIERLQSIINGKTFVTDSAHEPALEHKDFDEWFASLSKGYWPSLQEVWAAARTAPPPADDVNAALNAWWTDPATDKHTKHVPEIVWAAAWRASRAAQPPGLRQGLERAIEIIEGIETPSDYYEPYKTRLVDALCDAVYSASTKEAKS